MVEDSLNSSKQIRPVTIVSLLVIVCGGGFAGWLYQFNLSQDNSETSTPQVTEIVNSRNESEFINRQFQGIITDISVDSSTLVLSIEENSYRMLFTEETMFFRQVRAEASTSPANDSPRGQSNSGGSAFTPLSLEVTPLESLLVGQSISGRVATEKKSLEAVDIYVLEEVVITK